MSRRFIVFIASVCALSMFGCDDGDAPEDGGTLVDAGLFDGGAPGDAGEAEDAGAMDDDAGVDGDGGADADGGAPVDGGPPDGDAGALDGGAMDAGVDAGPADAGVDAGGACHGYAFGAPAVPFQNVAALSWTDEVGGGTIAPGTYDAVRVETVGTSGGMYRATWVFEDATTLAQLQQFTLAGPGPVIPRRFAWSTAGQTLTRIETCPGTEDFTQTYRVRNEGGQTFLDVREGTSLMFTFRRR